MSTFVQLPQTQHDMSNVLVDGYQIDHRQLGFNAVMMKVVVHGSVRESNTRYNPVSYLTVFF